MSDRRNTRSHGSPAFSSNSGGAQRTRRPRRDFADTALARRNALCRFLSCTGNGAIGVVHTIVPPGGILSGAFNMASASIGAGILGLPSATDSAGLVLAMIYLLIITYLSVFSMYILALAAQSTRIKSFEGMARWLFPYGNYAFSYWAAFVRWFHSFAACVAYVISLGNCFSAIFNDALVKHPDNSAIKFFATTQGNRVITCLVWFCVMLPMVVPKHIDSLRYASAIAISFMVYFVVVVVIHSCRNGLPKTAQHVRVSGAQNNDSMLKFNTVFLFRSSNSVIHTVGVFVFAYVCQINTFEEKTEIPVATPATSTWCYGPVPRVEGGSQEPATSAVGQGRAGSGIGKQVKGGFPSRRPGTMFISAPPCIAHARRRVELSLGKVVAMCRLRLLLSGDIEQNPGPTLRMAQWNVRGLSSKQSVLEKRLKDGRVSVGLVVETNFTPDRCLSFHVDGYTHYGYANPSGDGGVSIFVLEGIPFQLGEAKLEEDLQVVTLDLLLGRDRLRVVAAYFPKGRMINVHSLAALSRCLPVGCSVVIGMDANAHHPEWEATYVGETTAGNHLATWGG